MDDDWGYPHDLGNLHIIYSYYSCIKLYHPSLVISISEVSFTTNPQPRSSWQRKHLEEQGIAPQRVLEEAQNLAEKQRKVKAGTKEGDGAGG